MTAPAPSRPSRPSKERSTLNAARSTDLPGELSLYEPGTVHEAHHFYTETLGFKTKDDVPVGTDRWLTVVSPDEPNGPEVLLEPDSHPAVRPYKKALVSDGIPAASFAVADVRVEHNRLQSLGVKFTQEPLDLGPVVTAVFDDTCGNLIQLAARK